MQLPKMFILRGLESPQFSSFFQAVQERAQLDT
jgi:hypothetical protein